MSKQTVSTGERFVIQVDVIDWEWVKKNMTTWANLKSVFKNWGDMLGK
nr:MAG TPA: hypothetical protein [Caudoviricetes sp.]